MGLSQISWLIPIVMIDRDSMTGLDYNRRPRAESIYDAAPRIDHVTIASQVLSTLYRHDGMIARLPHSKLTYGQRLHNTLWFLETLRYWTPKSVKRPIAHRTHYYRRKAMWRLTNTLGFDTIPSINSVYSIMRQENMVLDNSNNTLNDVSFS